MASRAEIDALKAVLAGLSESDIVKVLGEDGLRAVISYIRNAPESDGADSVLALVGGKLRSMPLASLAELVATGVTFTVVPSPSDARVTINGRETERAFVAYGSTVEWEVSKDGYVTKSGSQVVTENTTIEVEIVEGARFTIVPTPEDADVYINGEKTSSLMVEKGSTVEWEVSESGYTTKTGSQVVTEDTTIAVEIVGEPFTFVYDSNSMYICQGASSSLSRTYTLFSINGAYDIEINGVLIENVTSSKTFGSEYLNDTGNVVKIYPYEGTVINSAYENPTSSSYYYSFMQNMYISEIQTWGLAVFGRCNYLIGAYQRYGALKSVPKLSNGFSAVTDMEGFFDYCNALKMEIPEDFFARAGSVTTLKWCFRQCSSLTGAIPAGLFANCTAVTSFQQCFYNCTGLTSIPSDLFASCASVTSFQYCFYNCTGLTAIPSGLFEGCASVTTFYGCFQGCTGLTSIPSDLFASCASVTSFSYCFYNCTGLTEDLPENLFASCTKVTDFSYCFRTNGTDSSYNKLYCESAYDRVDIDGVETIIHLYERENYPDLYTAPTNTSYCYQNRSNLADYDSIPSGWK